ncbi:MAG: calcium/sodium antiporter [Candidatus Latescibacteria bacterium]|nr:calcium/sodium antiporter [Candidatus Latescibacterota bacterium]
MTIALPVFFFILGAFLLAKGADWLVSGSVDVGYCLKIQPIYIGLTVVAFGTSLPELFVSLFAIATNRPGISIGNIIGSNIANIGLIIGITALAYPMAVKRRTIAYEFPMMIILSFLLVILGNKNYIFGRNSFYFGKSDGCVFILIFCIFLLYLYKSVKSGKDLFEMEQEIEWVHKHKNPLWKNGLFILLGSVMLLIGGRTIVESGVDIARFFGIGEVVIGLTIVSVGTSLPELATTLAAARKDHADLAIGNIIGSNIFNIAWVLGLVSLIKNIVVSAKVIYFDSVVMVVFTLVFFLFAAKSKKITRGYGAVLLAGYILYIGFLVFAA